MHPRFIGKRVVDFLLVIIKLFQLSVTADALRAYWMFTLSVFKRMAYDLENLINSWPNCWKYLCKIWFKF